MNNKQETYPFQIVPMDIHHCQDICTWVYEPPYDIYEWSSWAQLERNAEEFGDSQIRETQYIAILDAHTQLLIGYAQLFPLANVTRLGLGMRPELCGQGIGSPFVRFIAEEARRRRPQDEIDLEVLAWNHRARKAYAKAGFIVADRYKRPTPKGTMDFLCMVYTPHQT